MSHSFFSLIEDDPVAGGATPIGPAGGDLSGSYPNPTVDGLQGVPVSSSAPLVNQALVFDGSEWSPSTLSTTPTGPAGGDLTGTYPNPTLVSTAVTPGSYPSTGQISTFTVDSKGRITNASSTTDGSSLTSLNASNISTGTLNVSRLPSNISATNISTGVVDNTEFDYLNGVTSNIQTQLDSKAPVFGSQTANTVYAAPNGMAGTPSFRALVAADIPNLDTSKITTGTLSVPRGGTGKSSYVVGDILYADTTTSIAGLAPVTPGYVVTSNGVGIASTYQAPITNTAGSNTLPVTYNVTTSFANTGLSVSVPSAGKYRIYGQIRCQLQVSVNTGNITIRLYDSTAGSAISNSERISSYSMASMLTGDTVPISEIITVSAASTIDLQAMIPAGPTYLSAQIVSDGSGRSRLFYEKIGP